MTLDGKSGILGSHLPFGDLRRGWNFRSLGHGDVDFEKIVRELNRIGYHGPLSVEWEDNGMDREFGAEESLDFVRGMNFAPSSVAFDKEHEEMKDKNSLESPLSRRGFIKSTAAAAAGLAIAGSVSAEQAPAGQAAAQTPPAGAPHPRRQALARRPPHRPHRRRRAGPRPYRVLPPHPGHPDRRRLRHLGVQPAIRQRIPPQIRPQRRPSTRITGTCWPRRRASRPSSSRRPTGCTPSTPTPAWRRGSTSTAKRRCPTRSRRPGPWSRRSAGPGSSSRSATSAAATRATSTPSTGSSGTRSSSAG